MKQDQVLVTGGSGFIAQHCIIALLRLGHRVRTTLRSPSRIAEVREHLRRGGEEPGDRLSFTVADLASDDGWAEGVQGCDYVLHGASPTPSGTYAGLEDWTRPAVDGNLRVLRAARDAGVKRVVLTSAFGAVGVGHPPRSQPFDEEDWSDVTAGIPPYQLSKTLSEQAAWAFIRQEGGGLELAAVNPTAVLGPVLGADYSHSIRMIKNMLEGMPGSPKINSGFVDVRDVADLHVLAMLKPEANGQRFLATAGDSLWMADVARILKQGMGTDGDRVSTRTLPNWLVRVGAASNPRMKEILWMLDLNLNASNAKARRLLGWTPRTAEEAILSTARSLVALGLIER